MIRIVHEVRRGRNGTGTAPARRRAAWEVAARHYPESDMPRRGGSLSEHRREFVPSPRIQGSSTLAGGKDLL